MKNIKKYILGMATALCLCQSCDVLDIDPTGNYSETTAFNSIKNLDLYVKGFYSIFYVNSQLYVDASCLMDDGASDLIKYSWYGVAAAPLLAPPVHGLESNGGQKYVSKLCCFLFCPFS